ncbi:MAG: HDIG domain-containing protein [Proteobacteria bacterium]|nr:HDIG domain-containing protein [Pseudomonadota bacterium]MBU1716941.1 HDIG domain-containing protein [Pseudomonadota bacterium]
MRLKRNWLDNYPLKMLTCLQEMSSACRTDIFLTGGAVRDWLRGEYTLDLDFTVSTDAFECGRFFVKHLGGAFVPLDENEGVVRIVWRDLSLDFASFREGTSGISEDLCRRDFTINALAVPLYLQNKKTVQAYEIIDPTGGLADLEQGIVRVTSDNVFVKDPLRLLRAFRFMAKFVYAIDPRTLKLISEHSSLIEHSARERITRELDQIMETDSAAQTMTEISTVGILRHLIPELEKGRQVGQPSSHHLDVYHHNLDALAKIEEIINRPDSFFKGYGPDLNSYLQEGRRTVRLKWAALLHDIGKVATSQVREDGRTTFYNHDQVGAGEAAVIGRRLRWSRDDIRSVSRFIELHMWPFHLNNAILKTGITARACLRLVKAVGDDLPGLFVLAMADSLAAQGEGKPPAMEKALVDLYARVDSVYQESIKPVLETRRLLSGDDLIAMGLAPGAVFRDILDGLEEAQVEGLVHSREEAVDWLGDFIDKNKTANE